MPDSACPTRGPATDLLWMWCVGAVWARKGIPGRRSPVSELTVCVFPSLPSWPLETPNPFPSPVHSGTPCEENKLPWYCLLQYFKCNCLQNNVTCVLISTVQENCALRVWNSGVCVLQPYNLHKIWKLWFKLYFSICRVKVTWNSRRQLFVQSDTEISPGVCVHPDPGLWKVPTHTFLLLLST